MLFIFCWGLEYSLREGHLHGFRKPHLSEPFRINAVPDGGLRTVGPAHQDRRL